MQGRFFISALLLANFSLATNLEIIPRLTGEALIEHIKTTSEEDINSLHRQQFVMGYLAGVADAHQGKT